MSLKSNFVRMSDTVDSLKRQIFNKYFFPVTRVD